MAALQALLANESELHADAGGKASTAPHVLCGPTAIAAFLIKVWSLPETISAQADLSTHLINGVPALLVRQNGRLSTALSLACDADRIHRIFAHRNPDKLAVIARATDTPS